MLHAERLTQILTDVAIAELLLEQATAHADRRELLERHLERAELRCEARAREIARSGERLLRRLQGHDSAQAEAAE